MALGPVGLDADGLLRILESLLVVILSRVYSRAVGVKDLVLGLDLDGLRELLTFGSLSAESFVE